MYPLLIVILVVILLGLVPWGGAGVARPAYLGWGGGYGPSGVVAVIVIVLVVLLLTGRL